MDTILCLAHVEKDGSIAKSSFETLGSAISLAKALPPATWAAGLVGENVQAAANAIANCGAANIFTVSGTAFAQPRYATDAAAAEALCRAANASVILAPATSRWARVAAGVAQRLNGRADTHATSISVENQEPRINRWYYRQRMEAVLLRKLRPWIILLEPGCCAPWAGSAGVAAVEPVAVPLDDRCLRTTCSGVRTPLADAQTIRPEADLLFVTGAGWTKKQADGRPHVKEAEELILKFLKNTQASLGSSKSLVDLSGEGQAVLPFLTHLNQIGQTGSTPRHPKGLATCCHGEEPHSVGWRFINERRAINLDANCGWSRGKADVLYVADAFAVVSKLNDFLTAE